MTDAERAARIDLAAAYRIVALHGWDDLIFTHISARVPGPAHHFLINPYHLMFEEITASSLVKIDVAGHAVDQPDALVNAAGFVIHSAIHMARADAAAVLHLHTPHGQAVSAMAAGLMPLTQSAMLVTADLAYHEYEGVATHEDERARLVADLGERNLLLLRNHGTLSVGASVGEAFLRMYLLERACEAQVHLMSGGADAVHRPAPASVETAGRQSAAGLRQIAARLAWPALLRKLDRIDPGYRD